MSSEKIEVPHIPQSPVLYGIDPTVTYKWVPLSFRKEFFDSAFAAFWERAGLSEIKDKAERDIIIDRDFTPKYRGRRVAAKGAPWVEIGPIPSELAMRLETATAIYQRQLSAANRETELEIEAIRKRKLSKDRMASEIRTIERRAKDENIARGTAIYGAELIQEVLSATVRGWNGFVLPFVSWEASSGVMPSSDQYELFWDIVHNNAWTATDFESFESAPDSQQV